MTGKKEYSAEMITVLEGLEEVKKKFGLVESRKRILGARNVS